MKHRFFLVLFLLFSSYSWATTKIMPLGNSITLSRANHSYRYYLQQLLKNGGYAFDFIGTQQYQSYADFDPDHEGHGGYKADQIAY